MKNFLKGLTAMLAIALVFSSCKKDSYQLGDTDAPKDVTITAEIVGKDATHPNGNGSGVVKFKVSSDYALAYKIDYDGTGINNDDKVLQNSSAGTYTYTDAPGEVRTYTATVYAYGRGGSVTKKSVDVAVLFIFPVPAEVVTRLTNDASKTWVVDKSVAGHLGVGPWGSNTSDWWNAGVNEKVACCNCFYTATYKFTKTGTGYSITVATPDGAFTKTGALSGGLAGVPATGDEGCYTYAGASGNFSFIPPVANIAGSVASIKLSNSQTFIGYGATQRLYQIVSISENAMTLRAQGTETGNAWYLKLKSL